MGHNLDKVAEECFELLPVRQNAGTAAGRSLLPEGTNAGKATEQRGDSHPVSGTLVPLGTRDLPDQPDEVQQRLDDLWQHRCLTTLMNLAARKDAKAGLAERVLAYLEAGDKAADGEDTRWKVMQYELLVALDRPKDLAQRLRAWIAAGDADNRWRLSLGYLEAESGRIPAAIRLFEAVRAADELRGADYRTLADWYMAENRREAYDRARIETFKVIEEVRLNNWLNQKLQFRQRNHGDRQPPPHELDVEVLYALTALFEKTSQPQGYLYLLQQFYAATRDFRLLAGLADAVVGHTAGQVYPFVRSMSGVLGEVRDEATADSIVERVVAARRRATTEVDRRALDLLEMLVERRAAELQNQPGPHVQKALAAMQRAWKREWSSGEPRLIAELLASRGRITQQPLADEQLRELESLHRDAQRGTADRLKIGTCLAQTDWGYARFDQAIDLLMESLDEYQAACGGVLPASANDALGVLIGYLESRMQYARGEKVIAEQLKHPVNQQQGCWLVDRLYQLYESAIANGGDVSLGRGAELYQAVEKKLRQDLDTPDQNHRYNLVSRLIGIYGAAHDKKLPGAAGDLRTFAFERLPDLLQRETNNYASMVSETANALHDIAGPRDGLAFLVQPHRRRARLVSAERPGRLEPILQYARRVADGGQGPWRGGKAAVGDRAQGASPRSAIAAAVQPDHLFETLTTTTGARRRPTSPAPPRKSGPRRNSPVRPANTSPTTCTPGWNTFRGRSRSCWMPTAARCSTKAGSRGSSNSCAGRTASPKPFPSSKRWSNAGPITCSIACGS